MPLGYEENKEYLLNQIKRAALIGYGYEDALYKYTEDSFDTFLEIQEDLENVSTNPDLCRSGIETLIVIERIDLIQKVFDRIDNSFGSKRFLYSAKLRQDDCDPAVESRLYLLLNWLFISAAEYNSVPAFNIARSSALTNQLDIQALFNGKYSRNLKPIIITATDNDSIEVLKALLDSGADVNAVNDEGATALHSACAREDLKCAEALIRRCAVLRYAQDKLGDTPAMKAAKKNNVAALQLLYPLVQQPPHESVNIADRDSYTPIANAAYLQKWDAVRFLLQIGADLKLNGVKYLGDTVSSVLNVMYNMGYKNTPKDLGQSVFDQVKATLSDAHRRSYASRFGFEDNQVQGLQ